MEKVHADWDTSFLFSVWKIFVFACGLPDPLPTANDRDTHNEQQQCRAKGKKNRVLGLA